MIICFARCWCSLWGCFVWLIRAAAKDPNLPAPPPPHTHTTGENDRMWRSDGWRGGGGKHSSLPAAVFMLTLTRALISSCPPPQRTYHREASVTSLVRMERKEGGGGWLAFRSLIFTASLNPWPSMIAFKAVKPQHPSLSFIIYVCGLRGGGGGKLKVNAR